MKLKIAMLMIASSLPLAGCGNKGPLVLPQAPVQVDPSVPVEPQVADDADTMPASEAPATDATEPATNEPVPTEPVPGEPVSTEPAPDAPTADAPAQDGDG